MFLHRYIRTPIHSEGRLSKMSKISNNTFAILPFSHQDTLTKLSSWVLGVYFSWWNHRMRFEMFHSNTKNVKARVRQYQMCCLHTTHLSDLKKGVNSDILKFIDRFNFWILTVIYIKVYIFGKEMSHRIYFRYQISPKMLISEKITKNHFLGSKFLWQANKITFELKMPKLLENHVKTHV